MPERPVFWPDPVLFRKTNGLFDNVFQSVLARLFKRESSTA